MFSQEPRRFLKKNQLMEVICQFRFPEILAIAAKPPVDFQEAIRDEFPQYSARKEIPAPTPSPGRIWTWRASPSGSCSSPVIWASWGRRM